MQLAFLGRVGLIASQRRKMPPLQKWRMPEFDLIREGRELGASSCLTLPQ